MDRLWGVRRCVWMSVDERGRKVAERGGLLRGILRGGGRRGGEEGGAEGAQGFECV